MICEATPEQVEYICKNMRESDKEELLTLYPASTDYYFLLFIRSTCYCLMMDKPICLFGFTDRGDTKEWWVIATEEIKKHFITALRESKYIFEHDKVMAHVHDKNTLSAKWLKWLGMVKESSFEVNGKIFDRWVKL